MEASTKAADPLASPTNPAHWFAWSVSGYLTLLSLPLLLFPRLLLILSTPRGAAGQAETPGPGAGDAVGAIGPDLTPLERYCSYSNAVAMLSIAAFLLILTGAVPVSTSPIPEASANGKSPFRMPAVVVATLYLATSALTSWVQAGSSAQLGIGAYGTVLAFCHASLALWGFGVFLFGNDLTRNAKKSGNPSATDKSVSNWPFKNQYAEEQKAKKRA